MPEKRATYYGIQKPTVPHQENWFAVHEKVPFQDNLPFLEIIGSLFHPTASTTGTMDA
jgi:hypothetical protein